jgi:hypothetical protein
MSSISFWAQDQSYWQGASALNSQLDAQNAAAAKIFASTSGTSGPTNVLAAATSASNSVINPFGQIFLNSSMGAAVLAAQEGNDRVSQQTAQVNTSTDRPAGDLSNQVTFQGSLGVNFGAAGPAMGGAYRFVSGSALTSAFQVAFGAKTSEGETIDTVSVVGNTMTGSTSGPNAHDVFTLSLTPDTGMYTFQLLAPVDQPTTKGSYNSIYLQGLMQATDAKGQKMSLPTVEMDVYNNYGDVSNQGNWALLHEGSLTYNAPNGIGSSTSSTSTSSGTSGSSSSGTSSSTAKTYTPPTNPLTGYAYTTSTSAGLGVINSLNIFT